MTKRHPEEEGCLLMEMSQLPRCFPGITGPCGAVWPIHKIDPNRKRHTELLAEAMGLGVLQFETTRLSTTLRRRRAGEAKRLSASTCGILLAGALAAAAGMGVASPAWSHDCVIKDWAIAAGVIARQPYGKASTFSAAQTDEVFAFANLDCTTVTGEAVFRFFRDDKMVLAVETPLRAGENWRTWAAVRAQPGHYLVMLEIERMILIEDTFDVVE